MPGSAPQPDPTLPVAESARPLPPPASPHPLPGTRSPQNVGPVLAWRPGLRRPSTCFSGPRLPGPQHSASSHVADQGAFTVLPGAPLWVTGLLGALEGELEGSLRSFSFGVSMKETKGVSSLPMGLNHSRGSCGFRPQGDSVGPPLEDGKERKSLRPLCFPPSFLSRPWKQRALNTAPDFHI